MIDISENVSFWKETENTQAIRENLGHTQATVKNNVHNCNWLQFLWSVVLLHSANLCWFTKGVEANHLAK